MPEEGWASKQNGELLRLAEIHFDIFLTTDRHLEFQQNLKTLDLSVIVLVAPTNDINDLRPLIPAINKTLKSAIAGEVVYIRG